MEKLQSAITEDEWIRYKWVDVTTTRDTERRFLQAREHTPEEAAAVAREISQRSEESPKPAGLWQRLRAIVK